MKVKKLYPGATLPSRAYANDAGLDLYTIHDALLPSLSAELKSNIEPYWISESLGYRNAFSDSLNLAKELVVKVYTGIAVEIPPGFVGLFCDKSGLGRKGIKVLGGVTDSGYRGELVVQLVNLGNDDVLIKAGEKCCQMLIMPIMISDPIWAETLSETERGGKGFGSSGV